MGYLEGSVVSIFFTNHNSERVDRGMSRNKFETGKLNCLAIQSMNQEEAVEWTNGAGEIFIYLAGELVQYTNSRVINHLDDGLVNLMEFPLEFEDASLPDMPVQSCP